MYTIGLTGSIGSGKSTVSRLMENKGVIVLDADKIARELTEPDSPIISELTNRFGNEILNDDGELDRRRLAEVAFSNESNREALSNMVTERVKDIMESRLRDFEISGAPLIVMDVPLLFEYGMDSDVDEVWTVAADTDLRYIRAKERDGISREDFDARDSLQMPQEEKIKRSHVVIRNDSDLETLKGKVNRELARVKESLLMDCL